MGDLDAAGFLVPVAVTTEDGRAQVDGLVVQRWIEGREPNSDPDWRAIAAELQRLHEFGRGRVQRPGCCAVTELADHRVSVDADLDAMPTEIVERLTSVFVEFTDIECSLIHGDAWAPNLRITDDGRVGMLDFDESRVDVVWHDLSSLGVHVLDEASHARAQQLSNAWEAANGWQIENTYARRRLAALGPDGLYERPFP